MSNPVPAHLAAQVEDLLRYSGTGDEMLTDERIRLYADLIVANAVPYNLQAEVARLIDDGWLSPAGDVLRYEDDSP